MTSYIDESTVMIHETKTLNELRIMVSAIPFTPSEGDIKTGKIPTRNAVVTCYRPEGDKWRVVVYQFTDAWGKVFLWSGDPEESVLITQRGEDKKYSTLDPIVNDFYRIIQGNGAVTLHIAHSTHERDAIEERLVDD